MQHHIIWDKSLSDKLTTYRENYGRHLVMTLTCSTALVSWYQYSAAILAWLDNGWNNLN